MAEEEKKMRWKRDIIAYMAIAKPDRMKINNAAAKEQNQPQYMRIDKLKTNIYIFIKTNKRYRSC